MPSSSLRHVLNEISAHVRALRAHEAGARAGRDPEHLHEMRVAVRRLRAILRASRALFDAHVGGPPAGRARLAGRRARPRPRSRRPRTPICGRDWPRSRAPSTGRDSGCSGASPPTGPGRGPISTGARQRALSADPGAARDVPLPAARAGIGRLPARRGRDGVEAAPQGGAEAARAPERGRAPRGAHQGQARALRGGAGARRRGRARQALHPPGQEAARHPWRSAGRCGNRTVSARCHRSHGARAGPRPRTSSSGSASAGRKPAPPSSRSGRSSSAGAERRGSPDGRS